MDVCSKITLALAATAGNSVSREHWKRLNCHVERDGERKNTTATRHGACWDLWERQFALFFLSVFFPLVQTGASYRVKLDSVSFRRLANVLPFKLRKRDKLCVHRFRWCYSVEMRFNPLEQRRRVRNCRQHRHLFPFSRSVELLRSE